MDSGFVRPPSKYALVDLGSLSGGDVFHFGNISTEIAVAEDALYMVVSGGKERSTQIVSSKDGLLLLRSDTYKVRYLPSARVLIHTS